MRFSPSFRSTVDTTIAPSRHKSSALPAPKTLQTTSLFGSSNPRSKNLELTSIAAFVPFGSSLPTPTDGTSVTPSSVLDSSLKLIDLPPTPSPPGNPKLDAGIPYLWQDWDRAAESTSRKGREPRNLRQQLQQLRQETQKQQRRNSDSETVSVKPAVSDGTAWPSPESEPELLRSQTSPASAQCESMITEEEPPEESRSHLQSLCLNFSQVETECQDKELDRDILQGVHILPLDADPDESNSEEQVLYALYFSSNPTVPTFPGDAPTKLLFPKWIRDRASTRPTMGVQSPVGPMMTAQLARYAPTQPAEQREPESPGYTKSASVCSPAAKCVATFSEWRALA